MRAAATVCAALLLVQVQLTAQSSKPVPAPDHQAAKEAVLSRDDVLLRVMRDELDRSRTLTLANLDKPYYIEYVVDDLDSFSVSASLGGILSQNRTRVRLPRVNVRVGGYDFDNTNYIFSDLYGGTRFDSEQLPLDNDYNVLRRHFWLASDREYKTAIDAIARKRAALKNMSVNDALPDFWKAEPVRKILDPRIDPVNEQLWTSRVRDLSKIFGQYPEVLFSAVGFNASRSTHYFLNSEGTIIRHPDAIYHVQFRAKGQASDGMSLRDGTVLQALDLNNLPGEADLKKAAAEVAANIRALSNAPVGEMYSGPVLFEGEAASQLFAELLGSNLSLPRRPVSEPGRTLPFSGSELEGRIGAQILPDFLTVVDDPLQTSWNGTPLFGHYMVDDEGVIPKPLTLIDKGKLTDFLRTRQPVKNFEASNGRARMPGPFGARTAAISNLFIEASTSVPFEELKQQLIKICQERGKPYGLVVRKMDYPSSADRGEIRRIAALAARSGGSRRPVSIPLLVYRLYPDGREELVRGLQF
ncbi:MAG: metallopeptidase TldD-related protein, partial [Bryobacteraceae bacterium]